MNKFFGRKTTSRSPNSSHTLYLGVDISFIANICSLSLSSEKGSFGSKSNRLSTMLRSPQSLASKPKKSISVPRQSKSYLPSFLFPSRAAIESSLKKSVLTTPFSHLTAIAPLRYAAWAAKGCVRRTLRCYLGKESNYILLVSKSSPTPQHPDIPWGCNATTYLRGNQENHTLRHKMAKNGKPLIGRSF